MNNPAVEIPCVLFIFNVMGAAFVLVGFIPGLFISTVLDQEALGLAVTAVVAGGIDDACREVESSEEEGRTSRPAAASSFSFRSRVRGALFSLVGIAQMAMRGN